MLKIHYAQYAIFQKKAASNKIKSCMKHVTSRMRPDSRKQLKTSEKQNNTQYQKDLFI